MIKVVVGLLTGAIIIGTSVRSVNALPEASFVCSQKTNVPALTNEMIYSAGSSASIQKSGYSNTSGCIKRDNALNTASLYALSRVTASSVINPK